MVLTQLNIPKQMWVPSKGVRGVNLISPIEKGLGTGTNDGHPSSSYHHKGNKFTHIVPPRCTFWGKQQFSKRGSKFGALILLGGPHCACDKHRAHYVQ